VYVCVLCGVCYVLCVCVCVCAKMGVIEVRMGMCASVHVCGLV